MDYDTLPEICNDLAAWRKYHAAATRPGSYHVWDRVNMRGAAYPIRIETEAFAAAYAPSEGVAQFIRLALQQTPHLLDEIEQLRLQVQELEAEREEQGTGPQLYQPKPAEGEKSQGWVRIQQ